MALNPNRFAIAACGLSAAALALGIFALATRSGAAPPVQEVGAGPADAIRELQRETASLRTEIEALRGAAPPSTQQILALSQRLATLEAAMVLRPPGSAGGERPPQPAASSSDPLDRFRPAYAAVKSLNASIAIRQNPDRTFAVSNADPALTGMPIAVEATRPDGVVEKYTVIAPAPGAAPMGR